MSKHDINYSFLESNTIMVILLCWIKERDGERERIKERGRKKEGRKCFI